MSSSDLALARALLDGSVEGDGRRRLRTTYCKKGSPEEPYARRELAEHLRSDGPVDRGIRMSLAALFNPLTGARLKIKIIGRPGGFDRIRKTQIAAHVYTEIEGGKSRKDAVASAAAKFGLSERMIEKIWDGYRAYGSLLLEGISPLPSSQRT
jgi:hypothetical protein